MKKVPVGASIAHAYEFLFGRFFQIVGTAWLPAGIFGFGYAWFLQSLDSLLPLKQGDVGGVTALLLLSAAAVLIATIIHAVIAISLTQEALGVRKDLTLAHLVVGPRELRLFFGYLRFYLLFIALYIALLAVCAGGIYAAHAYGAGLVPQYKPGNMPVAVIAAAFITVLLAIAFFLSMIRLSFLLAPVAAVEHRTRLSRAWALTHGSTWRVFFVVLVVAVPVVIAVGAAVYYLIGPAEFAALAKSLKAAKPGPNKLVLDFYAAHAATLGLVAAVMAVLNGALVAGASAHAYRVTSGHEDPELEDDAALVAPLLTPVEEPVHHEPSAPEDHGHGHDSHGHHEEHHEPEESEDEASDEGHHGHAEEDAHGDNGHGGHGNHGHEDHGHNDHDHGGHDEHDHGHHGHSDHGHEDHQGHGHEDHGHSDHGHHSHGDSHHAGHESQDSDAHGHDDHGHHAAAPEHHPA